MTLPRLKAMQDHWRDFPPVHITAAALAGIKPSAAPRAAASPTGLISNAELWADIHTDPRKLTWRNAA